jgi:selenocysteine-specific elongation factor
LPVAGAVDVRLDAVRDLAKPLRHNTNVTFHTGAAEVPGKVRLLDRDDLPAGESAWAQVRLDAPLAAVKGDAFVIRSPNATLGGGRIVETRAKRHRRHHEATLRTLASLAEGSPEDAVYALIERLQPVAPAALARQTDLGDAGVRDAVRALLDGERIIALGEGNESATLLFTAPGLASLTDTAIGALAAFFADHPLRAGMPREELRSRLHLQARPFAAVLAHWIESGVLVESGAVVAPADRAVRLTPQQERAAAAFVAELEANPYSPQPAAALPPDLLAYLADQGRVVPVGEGVVFTKEAYEAMVARVRAHLEREGTVTLAQVRDLFGTSRKYAQALLEHLDEQRITRRVGDERVLR